MPLLVATGTKGPRLYTRSSSSSPPSLDLCLIAVRRPPRGQPALPPSARRLLPVLVHRPTTDLRAGCPTSIPGRPRATPPSIVIPMPSRPLLVTPRPPALSVHAGRAAIIRGHTRARVPRTVNLPSAAPPSPARVMPPSARGLHPVLVRAVR